VGQVRTDEPSLGTELPIDTFEPNAGPVADRIDADRRDAVLVEQFVRGGEGAVANGFRLYTLTACIANHRSLR